MAILTSLPTNYGVNAEYLKINTVILRNTERVLEIQYSGYVSEEARRTSSNPVYNNVLVLELDQLNKNPISDFYNLLTNTESSDSYYNPAYSGTSDVDNSSEAVYRVVKDSYSSPTVPLDLLDQYT